MRKEEIYVKTKNKTIKDEFIPLENKIRFLFFSGKGGVGKSTLSAATAVWFADHGYRTLLASTDLQRSQDDIFKQEFDIVPTAVKNMENLWVLNTDVEKNIQKHQIRQVSIMENILGNVPELSFIKEHYSQNPCCETASWNRLTEFMNSKDFDVVVFDTAPGGHSLETIIFPIKQAQKIKGIIDAKKASAELSGKEADIEIFDQMVKENEQAINIMRSEQTKYTMIMHPRRLALFESERLIEALAKVNFKADAIIINEVLPEEEVDKSSHFFKSIYELQNKFIKMAKDKFSNLTITVLPMRANEVIGINALREIGNLLFK